MGARRRRGLSDLIGEIGNAPQESGRQRAPEYERAASERESQGPHVNVESGEGETGDGGEAAVDTASSRTVTRQERPALPKYLRLERKEARLRGDQIDALASLARRANRLKKERGGERITENTLIRVAVDWILSQEAYIGGSTEEEIRQGLGVPNSNTR